MPCSSLEDYLQPVLGKPPLNRTVIAAYTMRALQAQTHAQAEAAMQGVPYSTGQLQGSFQGLPLQPQGPSDDPELKISPPHVIREGKPWPTLPPLQEAFQEKLWQQKEDRQHQIVKSVRNRMRMSRIAAYQAAELEAEWKLRNGEPRVDTGDMPSRRRPMSQQEAHRLHDHLTLDTTRKLNGPGLFGYFPGIDVSHRVAGTKIQKLKAFRDIPKPRRSERLRENAVRKTKAAECGPQKEESLSILARIRSAGSLNDREPAATPRPESKSSKTTVKPPRAQGLRGTKRPVATLRPVTTVKRKRVRFADES
ncbi:hypothetical protein TWF481_002071 [Arthrobotrys musiformis]|uniref:Uncharacterized protein n=1 Tax=Arthrobotrys musiformis TaxID=47236 RepID=A0AAV9VU28_9PEZI